MKFVSIKIKKIKQLFYFLVDSNIQKPFYDFFFKKNFEQYNLVVNFFLSHNSILEPETFPLVTKGLAYGLN